MGYSQQYQRARAKAHAVTRRCRRWEQYYETSDQDTENLCLRCLHDREFEQRVAEWFLKSPFARFELYSIFDEGRVRVILNGGRDWVEFEKEHPVHRGDTAEEDPRAHGRCVKAGSQLATPSQQRICFRPGLDARLFLAADELLSDTPVFPIGCPKRGCGEKTAVWFRDLPEVAD